MSRTLIIVVVIAIALGMYGCSSYNGLVEKDTQVEKSWANVQTQYQRRADLIPEPGKNGAGRG
jgi:LemA protein